MSDVERFRRKILETVPAREVADYVYRLECGHFEHGQTGTTHASALKRKSVICQTCRQEDAQPAETSTLWAQRIGPRGVDNPDLEA